MLPLLFLCFLLLFNSFPRNALCQDEYEVEDEGPIRLRALLDVRIAQGGDASSWVDRGPGKTRYGGDGTDEVTDIVLSQLALELGTTLPWEIEGHAQLNLETLDDDDYDRPLLIEAYLRKEWGEWGKGWGLQTGVMNVPFSLEHTGPAWTPQYTLTPSALNTWIWEELRVVGVEGEWWQIMPKGIRLDLFAGLGFGPDQFGSLLAERGWVFSDYVAGVNSELPLPAAGAETSVFDERDHRPAVYAGLNLSAPEERGEIRLGYFDNLGDQRENGVWHTRFGTLGIILRPIAKTEVLLQYLLGEVQTRVNAWDSSFSAFYALLSFHHRGHRLSARYDVFRVHDQDGAPRFSEERGDGVTLAYLFEFGLHHRVGFEYIFAHSHHPSFLGPDPSDDSWQLSYRYRF